MKRILTLILILAFLGGFSIGMVTDVSYAGEGDEIEVYVDIKPGACPNYFNIKCRGFLPVAILGTQEFDVSTIDAEETLFYKEAGEGTVAPVKWTYEDVATPVYEKENSCDCNNLDGDGYIDLVLKFDAQELVGTLKLAECVNETVLLTLISEVEENDEDDDEDEYKIIGRDCIFVTDRKPDKGSKF